MSGAGLTLRHFSPNRIVLGNRQYPQDQALKPFGLWVSVEGNGDGWSDWCQSEEFETENLTHEHEVVLSPEADVLHIEGPEGLDEFSGQYLLGDGPHFGVIDWPRVAEKYQGILITPYLWSRRHTPHTFWYYPWDCASGCIWDLTAIQSVRLLEAAS